MRCFFFFIRVQWEKKLITQMPWGESKCKCSEVGKEITHHSWLSTPGGPPFLPDAYTGIFYLPQQIQTILDWDSLLQKGIVIWHMHSKSKLSLKRVSQMSCTTHQELDHQRSTENDHTQYRSSVQQMHVLPYNYSVVILLRWRIRDFTVASQSFS